MTGFCYAIQVGELIKLGYSRAPDRRFAEIKYSSGQPCTFIGAVEATMGQEQELHRLLASERAADFEWYRPGGKLVTAFVESVRDRNVLPDESRGRTRVSRGPRTKLSEYLQTQGVSETDMARQIGVSQVAVNRYRRGERIPEAAIMARIVQATDGAVTPNDFYGVAPAHPTNPDTEAA
jgi:hypothetical protein